MFINKLLCKNCHKLVTYKLFTDFTIMPILCENVVFSETYGICEICKNKIFIPEKCGKNAERFYEEYRTAQEKYNGEN